MVTIEIYRLFIFLAFTIITGVTAFCCWRIIRKYWKYFNNDSLSNQERTFTTIRIVIMIPPSLVFTFGFAFFAVKTLTELF